MKPVSRGLFLVFLLLAIVFDAVMGMASTISTPTFQSGMSKCTIGVNTQSCVINTNFSPVFPAIPQFISQFNGTPPTVAEFVTGSVVLNRFVSIQAVNSTVWFNMPTSDSPTELYGQSNQRVLMDTDFGTIGFLVGQLCVDVVQFSQNNTATLSAQWSSGGAFSEFGDSSFRVNIGTNNGFFCGVAETLTIPTGVELTVRAVGRDGAGSFFCSPTCASTCNLADNVAGTGTNPDCPQLGTIEFLWGYSVPVFVQCNISVLSLTASVGRTLIRCPAGLIASATFSITWFAEG